MIHNALRFHRICFFTLITIAQSSHTKNISPFLKLRGAWTETELWVSSNIMKTWINYIVWFESICKFLNAFCIVLIIKTGITIIGITIIGVWVFRVGFIFRQVWNDTFSCRIGCNILPDLPVWSTLYCGCLRTVFLNLQKLLFIRQNRILAILNFRILYSVSTLVLSRSFY